jgi:Family of unknown function (DUF6152)
MKRAAAVLLLFGALMCGRQAYAHHSFGATYVENKQLSIEGELVQFVYRNPHTLLQVMAPDSNRQLQRWTVEWEARGQLDHQGVTSMTLKPGDRIVITGNPGKNDADHWLRAQSIVRPKDGWKWTLSAGSMR